MTSLRPRGAAWLLVSPPLVLLTAIVLLPELVALFLSFTNYALGRSWRFVGLENYARVLTDEAFWSALRINAVFVVGAVTLEMAAGFFLACLLARRFRLQGLWVTLILAPMAMSPAVTAIIWSYLLSYDIGPVNYAMGLLGLPRQQWLSSTAITLWVVIFVEFWAALPNVVLMLYPARTVLPDSLYEAAAIDGAGAWSMFRRITWPLMLPAFGVALIFRIMITIRAFGLVWILTGGGPYRSTEIISIYLYKIGFRYWQFGTAAAIAWLVLLMTAAIASHQVWLMYRRMFVEHRPW
jgi:multiple sugar transport system permease protein